jgi:hypothetical protein
MPSGSVPISAGIPRRGDRLRGGHAPGHLREAFLSYLSGEAEDLVLENFWYSERKQAWWSDLTPAQRLRWLCGKLWNCTDIVPWDARLEALERLDFNEGAYDRVGSYAQIAQAVMRGYHAPLRAQDDQP